MGRKISGKEIDRAITIQKLKEKKLQLDRKLTEAVQNFEEETGVRIDYIEINHIDVRTAQSSKKEAISKIETGVKLAI